MTLTKGERYERELAKFAARRERMKQMRAELNDDGTTKYSLQQIGDKFGISRARVSQLLKDDK
jgi:DNA-directed RNA polymerase sigma subunit (sigma70/sigma32)